MRGISLKPHFSKNDFKVLSYICIKTIIFIKKNYLNYILYYIPFFNIADERKIIRKLKYHRFKDNFFSRPCLSSFKKCLTLRAQMGSDTHHVVLWTESNVTLFWMHHIAYFNWNGNSQLPSCPSDAVINWLKDCRENLTIPQSSMIFTTALNRAFGKRLSYHQFWLCEIVYLKDNICHIVWNIFLKIDKKPSSITCRKNV